MSGFFSGFRRRSGEDYNLQKLVDQRIIEDSSTKRSGFHLICDIDKTYLETEFESLVKMAKIPFEGAKDKITVRGASEVLQAYRWGGPMEGDNSDARFPQALHFVSSSPPQLRSVLEEKLALDGLDWSSDTFKNQVYNLKKGRFDQLRQQAGYKSAAIIGLLKKMNSGARVVFIGDDAESDAFIYLGIKLLSERRLSIEGYKEYMRISGVENKVLDTLGEIARFEFSCEICGILIRNLSGSRFRRRDPLTTPIRLFSDFFEVAVILVGIGFVENPALWHLVRAFHNQHGISLERIVEILVVAKAHFSEQPTFGTEISKILDRIQAGRKIRCIDDDVSDYPEFFPSGRMESQLDEGEIIAQAKAWVQELKLNV